MRFVNPLPFVSDMSRSVVFYREVLGLSVIADHGNFVQFGNGFALHDGSTLLQTIFGNANAAEKPYGRKNFVLYFQVEDIEATAAEIESKVDLIHSLCQQTWGERVFRFRDPDGHIIEIGEAQQGSKRKKTT
ncbi:VOC family protein [Ruegeria sp. EL01]|jgi:catechol 2,3-dioxygenase-like lactoylglutathione lyase family enzyme|uniref:VOC family protein n=1 Tax=Ruegeria sp. EL01 TaxID=2107578 RepID=UPI000EA81984|nr:VOC family protein [Ruegeria sp. EL01]